MPMVFGAKLSFYGVLIYVLLGLIGLPIFAAGGGLGYVLKPTFGFILGFLLSTIPAGLIAKKFDNKKGYLLAGFVSLAIVDFIGSAWLYANLNYLQDKDMSYISALTVSVAPFIIFDVIKIVGDVLSVPILKNILKRSNII